MTNTNQIPAYWRANTDTVIVFNMDNYEEREEIDKLPLCKFCSQLLGDKYYGMDSEGFVEVLKAANAAVDEQDELHNVEVDVHGYTSDWHEISRIYREKHNYTCEKCGVKVSPMESQYMQVHHISGDKTNNRDSNLQCLCIKCHSEVDAGHVHNFSTRAQNVLIKSYMANYGSERFKNQNHSRRISIKDLLNRIITNE